MGSSRLWVAQEVALAVESDCFWGSSRFPLESALAVAHAGALSPDTSGLTGDASAGMRAASYMAKLVYIEPHLRRGASETLPTLHRDVFRLTRELRTSDSRDNVFAVRSLVRFYDGTNTTLGLLAPDYRKPAGAVFRDATRALLKIQENWILDEVSHHSSVEMLADGKTSWTAIWGEQPEMLKHMEFYMPRNTLAGLPPNPSIGSVGRVNVLQNLDPRRELPSPEVLAVKGFLLARVNRATVAQDSTVLQTDQDAVALLTHAVLHLIRSQHPYDSIGRESAQLAARVLSGGWWDVERADLIWRTFEAVREFLSLAAQGHLVGPGNSLRALEFLQSVRQNAANRCFFSTSAMLEVPWPVFIGAGPRIMEVGDVLAVLHGAKLPCILRDTERGDGTFYYIGSAYVPSLNKGEVFALGLPLKPLRLR